MDILSVLNSSETVRSACYRLGISDAYLRKLCRQDPTLAKALRQVSCRGKKKSGRIQSRGLKSIASGRVSVYETDCDTSIARKLLTPSMARVKV